MEDQVDPPEAEEEEKETPRQPQEVVCCLRVGCFLCWESNVEKPKAFAKVQ